MTEKIMSFNLRFDNPEDYENNWKYRIDKVGQMISGYEPMVIGTQEGLHPMLKDLEKVLPNYSWCGKGRGGDLEDEFCAIFYNKQKLSCIMEGQFWLSEEPDTPNTISWSSALPRICTWGLFKFKENSRQEFYIFNTHLDHKSAEARKKGSLLIWERLTEKIKDKNIPTILMGDFNSEPDSQVIKFLSGKLELAGKKSKLKNANEKLAGEEKSTFHNFKGGNVGKTIDYIFYTENINIKNTIIDQKKIDRSYPSDHYPVIIEVDF